MNNVFNSQILAEKLSKVNNSQQSIETLSHWCIFHRKKARQVVETWEELFNSCQQEQRVPFLYLANDILQNSRRKGSEFVNEFWKVLPKVLKDVVQNGDDHAKGVVARLVDIWDERKVFGSRGRGLKDEMFGTDPPKEPPVSVENNGKSSNSIKIVKKDAHSIRIKMAVGGMPEKIVTAFQSVHDEHFNEDTTLNKCRTAVRRVEKMEKDVDDACTHGIQQGSSLANDLEELETVLKQCMQQLGSIEAARGALIARLKDALQEQESKLEVIRTQVQIAQVQTELATSMRQRLSSSSILNSGIGAGSNPTISTSITAFAAAAASTPPPDSASAPEPNVAPVPPSTGPQSPRLQPVTSFATPMPTSDEQQKKAAAAAMAAKLAASTSSAQMLSSVLSSLAAEEAAAAASSLSGGGPNSSPYTTTLSTFPPEKRPKLEKPMTVGDITSSTYFNSVPQNTQLQSPFPPPPPLPAGPPQVQQFVQSNGMMVGVVPYAFNPSSASSLPPPPPPPPPPSNMLVGLARPGTPSQTQTQPQQQQHSVTTGFYQSPPGMGFYGQNHPATPPVPRQ